MAEGQTRESSLEDGLDGIEMLAIHEASLGLSQAVQNLLGAGVGIEVLFWVEEHRLIV